MVFKGTVTGLGTKPTGMAIIEGYIDEGRHR